MSFDNRIAANSQAVQKLLDENAQLIQTIVDYQNKGKAVECVQYQQLLHKNLVYLANLADSSQNINAMIPPPPQISSSVTASPTPPSSTTGGNQQERKMVANHNLEQSNIMSPRQTPTTSNIVSDTFAPTSASGIQSMKTSNTPPVTGYHGNPMMPPAGQGMLPGQQGYMPTMQPGQHAANQQYMMPQASYTQQQIHSSQQSFLPNQNAVTSQTPGIMGYQQPPPSYDQYNHVTEFNHSYGQQ